MNDWLGLKKLDKNLKKTFTDKPFIDKKIFKEDYIKIQSKKSKHKVGDRLVSKKDEATIREGIKYTKDVMRFLYKFATKNKLPSDYESLCAMAEKLHLEEKTEIQKDDLIKFIRTYRQLEREERKMKRIARLHKIGNMFKRKEKPVTRFCSKCGRSVIIWGDLAKQLCIVCDEVNNK